MIDAIIVGLGNPGKDYARTRHNVGEETIALLCKRLGEQLKAGRDKAVGALMRRHRIIDPAQLIIVHDELDLETGVVRVKVGGGLAGNNGLRSITQHLHTQDYLRVRIGIGKPRSKEQGADHVLSRVPKAEREILDVMIERAADIVELIVTEGADSAMQRFNGL